ncbi:MAG: glycogen synthase [Gammaproteobacteria bacterium]|nr:glycogen synthase [Gammaproteobacteria bacterium]NIR83688.1 glycogen synthase [Gammaproteobacteria bacterium]NIR91663.1 glycogen synthase [Gammaproteobacteria bacterium]NIU04850.1 glycogen synthase [Gammaproteobacteria bacterium]NIV51836.1 glycosyltransferase [Gammaproteobacteria bacterium]
MNGNLHILMVAAENDALPGGKVGGIGDVVRDAPPALAARGCEVTVLTPAYGAFAALPDARLMGSVAVGFRGSRELLRFYEVRGRTAHARVRHVVVDHPLFAACGAGRIYCDDPPDTPFATDANKFALFGAAAAQALARGVIVRPDVVHLHDWHAALVLALRRFHSDYAGLRDLRTVFTIHNLALQGIRPFRGYASSLERWFPDLVYDPSVLADPRWPHCVNPMAVGIRLADAVHTVSPTYAREILEPSAVQTRGYYGGEGLEADLRDAHSAGRLFGILNGCEYPEASPTALSWPDLVALLRRQVVRWAGSEAVLRSAHFVADQRLSEWSHKAPGVVLTSVGRITEQKVRLLREPDANGRPALEGVLEALGDDGVYLFLGTGAAEYEQFFTSVSAGASGFVFLRGYSDVVARALYAAGDLFLMPSSFEPCGISQMLAMRAGQPCLVHDVGGLRDTVQDGVDGFAFDGEGLADQAEGLVARLRTALELRRTGAGRWRAIRQAAANARFSWDDTVAAYIQKLYRSPPRPRKVSGADTASKKRSAKRTKFTKKNQKM